MLVKTPDPFLSSMLARASLRRLSGVMGILAMLWLAIVWAVALP